MSRFRVKEIAQAQGLTQEMIAQRSEGKVTISTVRRLWQNKGVTKPHPQTMAALAAVLGVSPEELTVEADQPAPEGASLQVNQRALVTALPQ